MAELARKTSSSFQGFMDKTEEVMNAEDSIRAFIESSQNVTN